jgi:hypothetical protein
VAAESVVAAAVTPRPTTQLKDAIVLAFLRGKRTEREVAFLRCPDIKNAINQEEKEAGQGGGLLNNEEVYNCLLRLEEAGEVERETATKRTVYWRAVRPDSLPVREPVRQLHI